MPDAVTTPAKPGKRHGRLGGRAKGTPNKVKTDIGAWFRELCEDPVYRANMAQKWRMGELETRIYAMGYGYAYGEPTKKHELTGANGGPILVEDHFAIPLPAKST